MPPASPPPSQKIVQVQQARSFNVLRSDTAVNLISIHPHKQRDYDVTRSRIAVYKQNWKIHQNTVCPANLKIGQKKRLTFYQTRSNAIILHNTPSSLYRKSGGMNSEEVLYNKIQESPRLPRKVVRILAWHEGRKDTSNSDERQSGVSSCQHRETCCGSNEDDMLPKTDYRIQGLPHSTDEHEDDTRKEVVNKLTHQLDTHPDREALKTDLRQNQAYNQLSEKSQNLIHSMRNVEFFEMCEISAGFECLKKWNVGRKYRDLQGKDESLRMAFGRIKEAFDLVAKDEVEKMSIAQEIMLKSTDYLR